ncbi:hypothetical protein B0O99DRAFT_527411 [Bisporella sp. PMI_857]|nr:hypothetical protein B0O99DRAFT_527411 [Bisporella sp. PMI_857]
MSSLEPIHDIPYGRRLLPTVLRDLCTHTPSRILGISTLPSTTPLQFSPLTASQLSVAVNATSYQLSSQLRPGNISPIAYLGVQDFRYLVVEIAAMQTSHPLLLFSPRNPPTNTLSLLREVGVESLYYSAEYKEAATRFRSFMPGLEIYELPSLESMLDPSLARPLYPYSKTYEEAKKDVVLILHTSGSTGVPKAIPYTHEFLARIDADMLIPPEPGRKLSGCSLMGEEGFYSATPFMHLSGVTTGCSVLFHGIRWIIGPSDRPPNANTIVSILKSQKPSGLVAVPSIFDAIYAEHRLEVEPYLKTMSQISWIGGPMAKETGDWIASCLGPNGAFWQGYGSTEMSMIPLLVTEREDWQWMEFHPEIGPTLERHPGTDLYEVVHRPHPNPDLDWSRPVFTIFPQLSEWRSKDLFRRHPTKLNLYMFESRTDDLIILTDTTKLNPLHIEVVLASHALLGACLVFGANQKRIGVLVEPKDPDLERRELIDGIWDRIEKVNEGMVERLRLGTDLIVATEPDRPLPRTGKGTVMRKAALDLYAAEIEDAYKHAGQSVVPIASAR